jgi:antitoxin MazE
MKTRIQEWGNDLGIVIPARVAEDLHLTAHSLVDISLVSGQLIIKVAYSLEDLLAGISNENLQDEIDTGPVVGREVL